MFGSKRKAERAERAAYWTAQANESARKAKEAREKAAFHRAESRKRGLWADPQANRAIATTYEQDARVHDANARDHRKAATYNSESTWQRELRTFRKARAKSKRARTARRKNFRKRLAKKLNLQTTTKKMHPTPPPGARNRGKTTAAGAPRAAAQQQGGKAAPMSQRVKRKGGKFNGSVADKKTATGKKTVAPNPEQRRLLAANTKAAQIDARLARTEKRIDRMFPEGGS